MQRKNVFAVLAFALIVMIWAAAADAATLYRWVDDNGVVHVSETPPAGKAAEALVDEPSAKQAPAQAPTAPGASTPQFKVRPGEVTIYTTPTCPWCAKAKAWLRDRKVRYREVDVTTDKKGYEEMVRISNQTGVPVIVVGDEVIIGFNQPLLEKRFE